MYQWFTVNANGELGKHQQELSPMVDVNGTEEMDSSFTQSGFTIVGPFDPSNPMSSVSQAAWDNLGEYLYQNSSFVSNPNWVATQLVSAKATQISVIQSAYTATLNAGFTSSANGAATVYGYASEDVKHMNMIASASALNIETWPINYADIHGNIVSLTQAQFSTLVTDASKFNWAQLTQYRSLVGNIQSATTVSEVQAVSWSAATY